MGAEEVPSGPFSSDAVVNDDKALVYAIRNALASVKNGDTDQYSQLLSLIWVEKESNVDAVAQQETLLKFLSASVADLDVVHHQRLLKLIFQMRFWDHKPNFIDALLDLIISLAIIGGTYLDISLNMLISNLLSQPRILDKKMREVISRVHEALDQICYIVPLAPSILAPILVNRMPSIHKKDKKDHVSVTTYVDNLLKLEKSSIGKVVGNVILDVVMERLRDLDLEIGWDDIIQDDSSRCMFDMELEDGEEGSLNQNDSVSELLDELMVLYFKHLQSCQNAGRLSEVFEILFESFEKLIMNTWRPKFSQFLMLYACSLDPGNCGVKFSSKLLDIFLSSNKPPVTRMSAVRYLASYLSRGKFLPSCFVASMLKRLVDECADYCRTCNDDASPQVHQVFYSGCEAILYVLCFRMRSILDVPRFQFHLTPLESVLSHKLNPLMMCLPSVVSEFLKQAKAGGLFFVSEAFIFDDLLESELPNASGGFERLDTFFPRLLKISKSFISPNFIYWSTVKTTYDVDDEDELFDEVIVNGDTDSEDDVGLVDNEVSKMSITPEHSFMRQTERLLKMPSRIRPSTSPRESL